MDEMVIARNINVRARDIMKRTIEQAVSLINILDASRRGEESEPGLSPWFLDCIYQAACAAAWLGAAASDPDAQTYASQKTACLDMLKKADKRWRVGGQYYPLCVSATCCLS
jgi:hypothetical protein